MNLNFDDYVSAGYYITTLYDDEKTYQQQEPMARELAVRKTLLPLHYFTLSGCKADFIPNIGWKLTEPEPFEIPTHIQPAIDTDLEHRFYHKQIGHPKAWYSLDHIRDFLDKFGEHISNTEIIGAGLHVRFLEDFFEAEREFDPDKTLAKNGAFVVVNMQQPVDPHGEVLGYEVAGFEYDIDHSMFCYHLVETCFEKYGIKPNKLGLYETLEEASICSHYANYDNEYGYSIGNCAWYPLLLIKYSIAAAQRK